MGDLQSSEIRNLDSNSAAPALRPKSFWSCQLDCSASMRLTLAALRGNWNGGNGLTAGSVACSFVLEKHPTHHVASNARLSTPCLPHSTCYTFLTLLDTRYLVRLCFAIAINTAQHPLDLSRNFRGPFISSFLFLNANAQLA
jgi:hypothetical protein